MSCAADGAGESARGSSGSDQMTTEENVWPNRAAGAKIERKKQRQTTRKAERRIRKSRNLGKKIDPADCYTIIHERNSVTRNIFTLAGGMSVSRTICSAARERIEGSGNDGEHKRFECTG